MYPIFIIILPLTSNDFLFRYVIYSIQTKYNHPIEIKKHLPTHTLSHTHTPIHKHIYIYIYIYIYICMYIIISGIYYNIYYIIMVDTLPFIL